MINLKSGKVITITGSALSSGTAWWFKSGQDRVLIGDINSIPLVLGPYINDALIDVTMSAGSFTYFYNGEGDQIPISLNIPRVKSEVSAASPNFNTNDYDIYEASAQAVGIDFANANITGTPRNGQLLIFIIASSTTVARAITYGSNFVSSTITMPTTTTASTAPITITFQYHKNYAGGGKWVCKGVA